MEDTLLHPVDAFRWHKRFRQLKRELAELLRDSLESPYPFDEMLTEAFGGKINFPDAFILKRLLEHYRPASILEVGSFVGFSTRWMLEVSSLWNGRVTSVDPNIRHRRFDAPGEILRRFNARFLPQNLEIVEGFFGTPGTFYDDYEMFEPKRSRQYVDALFASRKRIDQEWQRKFDFIFIDGDHTYEAARENFEIAVRLLNEGGCIAFHDPLSWPGVKKAIKAIAREYAGRAETRIFGSMDHFIFQGLLRKYTDGIGFFRMLPNGMTGG